MQTITKHVKGDITVDNNTNLTGMISGNIHVTSNAVFNIHGMVNGQITIDNNSTVIVFGTINGNITNFGRCEIYGNVNGKLLPLRNEFKIDGKAVINDN